MKEEKKRKKNPAPYTRDPHSPPALVGSGGEENMISTQWHGSAGQPASQGLRGLGKSPAVSIYSTLQLLKKNGVTGGKEGPGLWNGRMDVSMDRCGGRNWIGGYGW